MYQRRPCARCGVVFQPVTSRNKHCSVPCRFWSAVQFGAFDGCWPWGLSHNAQTGYGQITEIPGKGARSTHRLAFEIANGAIPQGLSVLHSCDNRSCCNPGHLFAGTTADNIADMWAKGRQNLGRRPRGADHALRKNPALACRGEMHGRAKLTADQVAEIRRIGRSVPGVQLGAHFGVSSHAIWSILKGRSWGAPGLRSAAKQATLDRMTPAK